MADRLHRQDARGEEFPFQAHLVHEILVFVVQRTQEAEVPQVQVRVLVLDVEVVQQYLSVSDVHLAGDVLQVQAGLVGDADVVRVRPDLPVLDQDVGGVDVRLDFQVVPVDDIGRDRGMPFLLHLGGGRVVDHPEREVLEVHLAGFQEVAEVLFGLVGVGFETEDARKVVRRLSVRSGLDDEVELAVLQPQPAHGDAFLAEKALDGETGGHMSYA